jgi:hypothetical protein
MYDIEDIDLHDEIERRLIAAERKRINDLYRTEGRGAAPHRAGT